MKIALISDTHDNTPAIVWIIEYLNTHNISIALHAGDLINPGILHRFHEHYSGHLHFILGNNDGERVGLTNRANGYENMTCYGDTMLLDLEGKSIFMHHFSDMSERVAEAQKYDLCIGGHDHLYRIKEFGKTLFINPGNTVTKDKWLPQEPDKESSFVLLDLRRLNMSE